MTSRLEVILTVLCVSFGQHTLGKSDYVGTSSGPRFTSEPPLHLDFSNSTQSSANCVATGSPSPSVTWITHEGASVTDVVGLRYVFRNGTLSFPAFRAEEYRQDVHASIYYCVASSFAGSVKSRPLHVRAVVQQYYEVQVYDEFVIVGNTAVLKCNIPTFVKDYVSVVEWIKSSSTILPSGIVTGSRYIVTATGDLYISQVRMSDNRDTYRCRTIHRLSQDLRLSSSAQIIVSDPQSSVPPRITHNVPAVQAQYGQTVEIPCAAQGWPFPTFRWAKEEGKIINPVQLSKRVRQLQSLLIIEDVQPEDSGVYVCIAFNSIGEEKVETILRVTVPLSVKLEPPEVLLDAARAVTFNCIVTGYPITSVTWLKNGQPVKPTERFRFLTQYILRIEDVQQDDRGMYQCIVQNNEDVAYGVAELKLGDVKPVLQDTFKTRILHPGSNVALRCSASGNPTPNITWFVDDTLVRESSLIAITGDVDGNGVHNGFLNLSSITIVEAGVYQCVASNQAGSVHHAATINVFGKPFIAPLKHVTAIAGRNLHIPCRAFGYPISLLTWEKDGHLLPTDRRQTVFANGSLMIQSVDRVLDGGTYVCIARNDDGDVAKQSVPIEVTVPPVIDAVSFPEVLLLRIGARARLQCVVTQGDLPLNILWLKNGRPLTSEFNVQLRKDDEFSSVITFTSITISHNGNYTCVVRNSAGSTNITSQLSVEVPPRWVLPPTDASVVSGGNVTIDCVAFGYPSPEITWKKALGRQLSEYREVFPTSYRIRILGNGSLSIQGAIDEDEGQYMCEAHNGIGVGINKVISLNVHASALFDIKYQNLTARKGETMTLQCQSRGEAPIFVSWSKNNQSLNIEHSNRLKRNDHSVPHGLLSELILTNVERQDEGIYGCKTWNSYGQDKSTIQLYVKEPPEIPDNVKIIDHSGRVVKLSWLHPYNGGSNILEYIIQYKKASEEWKPNLHNLTTSGLNSSTIIRGLIPGTPYSFRVIARNMFGTSLPSNGVGITTAEEVPAGPPLDLRAKSAGSQALLLTWKRPRVELSNGDILGYYVGYKILNSTDTYQYYPMETNKAIMGEIQLKITKLLKYTKYNVAVQAFNRMGKGPFSPEIVISTDEDVPGKPPEQVSCIGISAHSVNVSWLPPPKLYQHGIILGYKVYYWPVSDDDKIKRVKLMIKTNRLQTTVDGLGQFTNYSLQALSYTRVGDGSISDSIFCNTLEDVPEPPEDIKVLAKSSSEVIVAWKNPANPNGAITKYTVYMRQPLDKSKATKRFTVDPHKSTLIVSGLTDNQHYEFWVTASTNVGEGQSTKVVSQSPHTKVPANITAFSGQIMQKWNMDVTLPCLTVGSPIPRREWRKGNLRLLPSSISTFAIGMDGSLFLRQVQRSDSGNYSCSVENVYGKDEINFEVFVQAPPDPPFVIVLETTASSVKLGWRPQDNGGCVIRGFYIHYKKEFGEWEEIKLLDDVTTHTLKGLQCGTQYQVTLSAFNKIGSGRQSDVLLATTKGSEPGIPKMQDVLFPNLTFAVLRLANWPSGGCPIHYFVLQYKHTFQREWTLISNNAQTQHEFVQIGELKPGEKYILMVTAHNDAGSTNAKYDFSTYTGILNQQMSSSKSDFNDNHLFYEDITVIIPIISSAITLVIILFGVAIFVRRRSYAGYFHTRNNVEHKKDISFSNYSPYVQQINKKSIRNDEASNCLKGVPEDVSPYATSNLQQCKDHVGSSRAAGFHLNTFSRHNMNRHFECHDAKSPSSYEIKDHYSTSIMQCGVKMDEGKKCGVVLRPQHYPSIEDMYSTQSAAPDGFIALPTDDHRVNNPRGQMFLLLDRKCGSNWDLRPSGSCGNVTYMSQSANRFPDQTKVPDLLYRETTDSSTPIESSPDEEHLHHCDKVFQQRHHQPYFS